MWASIMRLVDDTAEGRRDKVDLIKNLSSDALTTSLQEKTRQDATVAERGDSELSDLVDKVIAHRLSKLDSVVGILGLRFTGGRLVRLRF
jgi:hypothetical protein